MPYEIGNPPEKIKKLPKHAQRIWIAAFNSAWEQYGHDEEKANKVAWSAVKKLYRKNDSGKWVKKKNSYSFPIYFSDVKIEKEMDIHILPVGEWKHAIYGDIKITEADITEFVYHFDTNIRKGVRITEGHDGMYETPAVGWFKKLTDKKAEGLWGTVEWNDKGRELLEQKAYKYFSPEYCTVYEDPETHRVYNNVLTGGALTNSPYFKGLKAIVMSEPIILNQFKSMTEEIKDKKEPLKEGIDENVIDKLTYREPIKNLSEKLVYQVINSTSGIDIEDKADLSEFKKELLRIGTWQHGAGKNGILEITKETLKSIVKNFKDKVLDNVFVPLGHPTTDDPSLNVGEVVDLSIEGENEDKLMATIDVKEKSIIGKIKDGLIKCISASLTENYTRKDTGEDVGPVLFHTALVSEPYIKGMAPFVPLSENMQGSTIVPIMNMEEPLTLQDLTLKIENMEKEIKDIKLNETKEEETKEEETSEETEPESSEVSSKAEEEEKGEAEEEETEAKETETKAEEAKESEESEESKDEEPKGDESEDTEETEDEGVALAEAEKMYAILLGDGRVTKAEKDLLIPALTSNSIIELSDGKQVNTRNQLFEYLKKQPRKFSLSEVGLTPDKKIGGKKIEMTEDANRAASKIAQALDLSEEERLEMIKEVEEEKRNR